MPRVIDAWEEAAGVMAGAVACAEVMAEGEAATGAGAVESDTATVKSGYSEKSVLESNWFILAGYNLGRLRLTLAILPRTSGLDMSDNHITKACSFGPTGVAG